MSVLRISRVIGVESLEKALSFYRDVLGLRVVSQSDGWVALTCGDGHLALQPFRRPEDEGKITPTGVILTVCLSPEYERPPPDQLLPAPRYVNPTPRTHSSSPVAGSRARGLSSTDAAP